MGFAVYVWFRIWVWGLQCWGLLGPSSAYLGFSKGVWLPRRPVAHNSRPRRVTIGLRMLGCLGVWWPFALEGGGLTNSIRGRSWQVLR